MRTVAEIFEYIEAQSEHDCFGFVIEALVEFLSFEEARPLLKPDVTPDGWTSKPRTRENILEAMRDYAAFGWGKIRDHRGLSTVRTVQKMTAWMWLLGDAEELRRKIDSDKIKYAQYGAPKLAAICKRYSFPIPQDKRTKRMMQGLKCTEDCDGCGV